MSKRINIILPDATVRVLEQVVEPRRRSRFISEAVLHYVGARSKANLKRQIKTGAVAQAERDLDIAREWFAVDEQAWQKSPSRKQRE